MDFKKLYDSIDCNVKEDFLYKLLQDNVELKIKFLDNYRHPEIEARGSIISYEDFLELVKGNFKNFSETMQDFNFDIDWEDYSYCHNHYVEE